MAESKPWWDTPIKDMLPPVPPKPADEKRPWWDTPMKDLMKPKPPAREDQKGRPGAGGSDPTERSVAAADVALPHSSMGALKGRSFHNQGYSEAPQNHPHYTTMGKPYRPPAAEMPPKLGAYPAPAKRADGYGHTSRDGHERMSGDPRAHRIGRK